MKTLNGKKFDVDNEEQLWLVIIDDSGEYKEGPYDRDGAEEKKSIAYNCGCDWREFSTEQAADNYINTDYT